MCSVQIKSTVQFRKARKECLLKATISYHYAPATWQRLIINTASIPWHPFKKPTPNLAERNDRESSIKWKKKDKLRTANQTPWNRKIMERWENDYWSSRDTKKPLGMMYSLLGTGSEKRKFCEHFWKTPKMWNEFLKHIFFIALKWLSLPAVTWLVVEVEYTMMRLQQVRVTGR